MSDKQHRLFLLQTNVSYVLVCPRSPSIPSDFRTFLSHSLAKGSSILPLSFSSPSAGLDKCPLLSPSLPCPRPWVPPPFCFAVLSSSSPLPMPSYALLPNSCFFSFPPESCSHISLFSFTRSEVEVTQPAEEAAGEVCGRVLPTCGSSSISAGLRPGLSSTAKPPSAKQNASEPPLRRGDMQHMGV